MADNGQILPPVSAQLRDAQTRAEPGSFSFSGKSVADVLLEAIQLAKLTATEARDLEAIRTDHTARMQHMENVHGEVMMLISQEYASRDSYAKMAHELARMLIQQGQYQAAQDMIKNLTAMLSDSPLKQAIEYRKARG